MLNDNSFSGVLYILSFVVAIIGIIIGILFLGKQVEMGTLMIMFSLVSGMILFGLGKAIQLLSEMKEGKVIQSSISSKPLHIEKVDHQSEEQMANSSDDPTPEPSRNEEEWGIKEIEKRNILEHYGQSGQKVEEIKTTPFGRICIVKAEDFIDVINLVNEQPVTLTRGEVEALPELQMWIEENIFGA